MSFPAGCSDHDFNFLMRLFRQQSPPQPFAEDEARLVRAGWLYRNLLGELAVTEEVERHFRATWRPIVDDSRPRRFVH